MLCVEAVVTYMAIWYEGKPYGMSFVGLQWEMIKLGVLLSSCQELYCVASCTCDVIMMSSPQCQI